METRIDAMKILFVFLLGFFATCTYNKSATNKTNVSNTDSILIKHQDWLKSYAFCACTLEGYKQEGYNVIDYSFGVFRDIASYDERAYQAIDSIVKKIIANTPRLQPADYNNKKPILKSCLEFYKSKLLDSVIHSFDEDMRAFIKEDIEER